MDNVITSSQKPLRKVCLGSAILGSVLYFVMVVLELGPFHLGLIEKLLLFAPLVIVPLGFSLLVPENGPESSLKFYKLLIWSQPFCATGALLSFGFTQGLLGGASAISWFLLTVGTALLGLWRICSRGLIWSEDLFSDIGFIYLSVGGGWFVISRFGLNPMGFDDTIVLLTAVHFHFAGFAAPIIIGTMWKILESHPPFPTRWYRISGIGTIVGIPLLAMGITFSPLLEIIAACVLAFSLMVFGFIILFAVIPRTKNLFSRVMFVVSGIAIVFSMVLALAYAFGTFGWHILIDIHQMAKLHGIANVFGFALCGLLGLICRR